MFKDFGEIAKALGIQISGWIIILIIVFISLVKYQDKVELLISKILNLFLWTGTSIKKQAIAREIRGRILKVSKELSNEIDGVLPYDLKVKWVKEVDADTFVKSNQVIIRMSNQKNKTKTIVYALNEYVVNGLLPKAKKYIDKKIIKSCDLLVVRKLLFSCYEEAVDYFDNKYLTPMLDSDEDVKEFIEKISKLDEAGLLIQVLLNEFIAQSKKIYPALPDECLMVESRSFVRFLFNIATKEPGEIVDLQFNGEYFKVAVILMLKTDTFGLHGISPYVSRSLKNLDAGIQTIYLLADSQFKSIIANEVAERVKQRDLRVKYIKRFSYKRRIGNKIIAKGICMAIHTLSDDEETEEDSAIV